MDLKVRTRNRIAGQFIFSQVTFYLLLATMVFVVIPLQQHLQQRGDQDDHRHPLPHRPGGQPGGLDPHPGGSQRRGAAHLQPRRRASTPDLPPAPSRQGARRLPFHPARRRVLPLCGRRGGRHLPRRSPGCRRQGRRDDLHRRRQLRRQVDPAQAAHRPLPSRRRPPPARRPAGRRRRARGVLAKPSSPSSSRTSISSAASTASAPWRPSAWRSCWRCSSWRARRSCGTASSPPSTSQAASASGWPCW